MAIEKNTDYGKVTIVDKVFEDALAALCQRPEFYDNIWLAQKPNVKVKYNQDNRIEMQFSVYVKFGQSIKAICKSFADKVASSVYKRIGEMPAIITVIVSGVKFNNMARRNMELVFEYPEESNTESL